MNKVMLDLETMGTGPNSAIIAIGAVEFCPDTKTLGREFYSTVCLRSSVRRGGVIDADTVMWWLGQEDCARRALVEDVKSIETALDCFSHWIYRGEDIEVWGNGAAFDNVILAQAYKRCDLEAPWPFWGDRCYRTLKALNPHIKMDRQGVHHNALDDAISQARHLIDILTANAGIHRAAEGRPVE